ncbi:MAG TPA: hypothetical protein PKC28_09730 [Bdellovibrionales bacterium]|nr:hypothetical protein [Bdellovibrionales bacterium]
MKPDGAILAIITSAYYDALQASAPSFYRRLVYRPLDSKLSLTQLTALLPLYGNPERTVPENELEPEELRFLATHRRILHLYWQKKWPPIPPWKIANFDVSDVDTLGEIYEILSRQPDA